MQTLWYVLIGVLLAGYAVLDGFDLGIGALYPFLGKDEADKRALRTAVGPVWDGNEVWLLTGGGALFAAFPVVYATVFSGFYMALMLVLFALIFRAVSLEFRAHDSGWSRLWDWSFFLGSLLPALLFGVAVGNLVRGVPLTVTTTPTLGPQVEYAGTFFTLLNPYSLLVGVLGLTAIVRHGAAWTALKTTGGLQRRARRAHALAQWIFLAALLATTVATAFVAPDQFHNNTTRVAGLVAIVVLLLGLAWERLSRARQSDRDAFLGSAVSLAALVGLWAVGNYPNLVPALGTPDHSLTVADSASSNLTLTAMLIITVVGLPLVLAYSVLVYRAFRGKVQAGEGAPGAY